MKTNYSILKRIKLDILLHDIKSFLPITILAAFIIYGCSYFDIILCPLKSLIGIPCPLCGTTRASLLLMSLKFKEAFNMNPIVYELLIWLAIMFYCRYVSSKYYNFIIISFQIICIITLIIYVMKMLLYFPYIEPCSYYAGCIFPKIGNKIYNLLCSI